MHWMQFQQKFGTEEACLRHLEESRWASNGKCRRCPHCDSARTYQFKSGKLFKCGDCRKQFTAKVGTMFSNSHVPLHKWYLAIYLAFSLRKGISATQFSRYFGVTQSTAWSMLQRIRNAIVTSGNRQLIGNVRSHEAYVGSASFEDLASEEDTKRRVKAEDQKILQPAEKPLKLTSPNGFEDTLCIIVQYKAAGQIHNRKGIYA